jgi:hypothetical protein
MSYSSLLNSPSFGQEYILQSFDSSLTVAVSPNATGYSEKPITVTTTDGAIPKYISLPAGKYLATMTCCLQATAINTTIFSAQLQIVDDTAISILYGSSSMYSKAFGATLANIPAITLYMNESVVIELTETKNLTLRLAYNANVACATIDTNLGVNPLIPGINQIVFRAFI